MFGETILKQTKGIPIGRRFTSIIADLILCHREFLFMKGHVKEKNRRLVKLSSENSRYVDDVGVLNYIYFEGIVNKIYTGSL